MTTHNLAREHAVGSLVRLDEPIEVLEARLARFGWDWEGPPLLILNGDAIASVLSRYIAGTVSAEDIEIWANMVESRDDIEFGPNASRAITELANPTLFGSLSTVVSALLARLG